MTKKLLKAATWVLLAAGLALSLSSATPARADGAPGAALLFEEALAAFDRGEIDKAITSYEAILSGHPESSLAPRALINLAKIFGDKKRNDEAHALIERGREKYSDVPGLRDQLDALEIHLGARSGKGGKLKPGDKDKAAKKLAEAQAKIAELTRQIDEARKAGRSEDLPGMEKELAKLRRKLAEEDSMKAGERSVAPRPGAEEVERLRQEQERLIIEAHALEDAGKVEEAFALRRRADELAAQVEAARRQGPVKPSRPQKPGATKPGATKPGQKAAQARLAELRRERAELEKARAEMESSEGMSEGMMESGEKEKDLAEKLARIEAEEKSIKAEMKAEMDRAKKGEVSGFDKELRKSMNEARKEYVDARKAQQQARQSGDVAAQTAANARLDAATSKLRELREKAESLAAEGREQAIERLRKAYKKQGLSESEIKARLDFARAEQHLSQEHQKAQSVKRAELAKAGQSEDQIRDALLVERQRFQAEAEARRRKHLADLEAQREEGEQSPGDESDDGEMMDSEKSMDAAPLRPTPEKRKDDSQSKSPALDQVMNREVTAPADSRLAGLADKLRKRGLSESDVARRLELQQERNEQSEIARPVLDPKARAKKVANIMEEQGRRIERLERELAQLRALVAELRGRLERGETSKD